MRLTLWAALLWIAGLLTLVPYSIYRLLFQASRDEYAFLIVFPLFWVFGYWGVAGPLIAAWRVHTLMQALEASRGSDEIRAAFERHEGQDVVIDLIASEYRLPRLLARRVYTRVARAILERQAAQP